MRLNDDAQDDTFERPFQPGSNFAWMKRNTFGQRSTFALGHLRCRRITSSALRAEIMAALSPERRQVFIDAAIDGKSYQQVADEQGVKIGTVMSRLNRARTQLKRELASYAKERGYVTGSSAGSPSAKLGENVGRIADSGHNGSSEQTVGSNGDTQAVVRHSHATGARTPQQSSKLSGKEI